MKCSFKDSNLLKRIINALSKDLTLVNFNFTDDGLKINAMNDSHTDMRDFFLHHTFFENKMRKTAARHIISKR